MMTTVSVRQSEAYKDKVLVDQLRLVKLSCRQPGLPSENGFENWWALVLPTPDSPKNYRSELRNVRYNGPRNPLVRAGLRK
jgi:hypothetical protein